MRLYEIEQAIMDCIDEETGEIIDLERLNQLMMDKQKKIEGVALWVKNLEADEAAFKKEKEVFEERQKAAAKKKERLMMWLTGVLNGQKFSTNKVAISFKKSTQVVMTDDAVIPLEFRKEKVEVTPDKNGIKKALKDGAIIPGFSLKENTNISIK